MRSARLHCTSSCEIALGRRAEKSEAFKVCAACPKLLEAFLTDTRKVQTIARTRLKVDPRDDDALFFLGKLNLNYVWLQLETLGRKTGWSAVLGS